MKNRGVVVLLVFGLLMLILAVVMAATIYLQETPGQTVDNVANALFDCLVCWLWAWYLSGTSRKGRRLTVVLSTMAIAFVCLVLPPKIVDFYHNRRIEGQARQLFIQAQEDAKPNWTEDDAVRWLSDHGINPYRGEESDPSGHHHAVDGYQQLEEGSRIVRPASVYLTFLFEMDHKFSRVEYHLWPFEPPGGKKGK